MLAGFSPAAQAIRLSGEVAFQFANGGSGQLHFKCEGENPCRGTSIAAMRTPQCSDEFGRVDSIVITGLSLSQPGPIAGSVTLAAIEGPDFRRNPYGSCEALAGTLGDFSTPFTGTWDGTNAQLVFPPNPEVSLSGHAAALHRLGRASWRRT